MADTKMSQSGSPSTSHTSPAPSPRQFPAKAATTNSISDTPVAPEVEIKEDSGPISSHWSEELLNRYTSELTKLDIEEEACMHRLAAIQKLQLLWSTAGRQGEMDWSDKRIKTRTTKVLLEDERLIKKRRKLSGAMAAIQNLVGLLDSSESAQNSQAST